MRNRIVNTFVLIAGLAATASVASAQTTQRLYEFGIDGSLDIAVSGPSRTTITIPAQALRVGFFLTPKWSLEPSAFLQSSTGDGGDATFWGLTLGALYHFSKQPVRPGVGLYARPYIGVIGNDNDDTRAGLGAGVGYKYRLTDRFAARGEANFSHVFGDDSQNVLGLRFGLSFFTR